jgi:hypothetical protein
LFATDGCPLTTHTILTHQSISGVMINEITGDSLPDTSSQ